MKFQDTLWLLLLSICWVGGLSAFMPRDAQSAEVVDKNTATTAQNPSAIVQDGVSYQDGNNQPDVPLPLQPATKSQAVADNAAILPEVGVKAGRIQDKRIDKTQSITKVTARDLERVQPATIFDAVRDVPGLEVSGGPRIGGMSFNVRGFQDNSDVTIKVDGVRKSFEKYRMGGTFVDPELLKSIEVQRGPQISSGSGSIGGTVLLETKDAADLLRPGQQVGARVKFGYSNNNDEYLRSYTAYTRPHEKIDILYNYTNRQSNNFTLPAGSVLSVGATPTARESELNFSQTSSIAELLKFTIFPTDSLQFATSVVKYKDSALALYDQITNLPGPYYQVYRDVDDLSITENIRFKPENFQWIDFKTVIGIGHTDVLETIYPGWQGNHGPAGGRTCRGFDLYSSAGALLAVNSPMCGGNKYEDYSFKNSALEFSNNAILYKNSSLTASLLAGFQHNKNERVGTAYFDNPASRVNDSIPSGIQSFNAVYLQPRLEWGRLSVIPGVRYDRYETEASENAQRELMQAGYADVIKFRQRSYSMGLNFDIIPQRLSLFSNYSQGFRAPMMLQYFSSDASRGSLCDEFLMPINRPPGTPSICGNLYKPQLSESTEIGIGYRNPRFMETKAQVTSKLTFFHIFTKNTLRSLMETSTGEIVQNGWERRNGVEVESAVEYEKSYARIGYSRLSGKMAAVETDLDAFANPTNPHLVEQAINSIPGNTLNITLGTGVIKNIDAYISYRKVGERLLAGNATQDGYEVFNAGIHLLVNRNLGFRLIGENLANKPYNYNGGGDFANQMGLPAAGRNIRFIAEMTY